MTYSTHLASKMFGLAAIAFLVCGCAIGRQPLEQNCQRQVVTRADALAGASRIHNFFE